jgi:hypothetical protein
LDQDIDDGSGSDLPRNTQLDCLVADAVITLVRHGVIALVVKQLNRDAGGERLALGGVRAAMGAEGALADRQVSGFADNREFDWCHLPLLLVPDVLFCLERAFSILVET